MAYSKTKHTPEELRRLNREKVYRWRRKHPKKAAAAKARHAAKKREHYNAYRRMWRKLRKAEQEAPARTATVEDLRAAGLRASDFL